MKTVRTTIAHVSSLGVPDEGRTHKPSTPRKYAFIWYGMLPGVPRGWRFGHLDYELIFSSKSM